MQHHPEYKYLGATAKARINGFTGKVNAISFRLGSAPGVDIEPSVDDKGNPQTGYIHDIHMCDFEHLLPENELPSVEEFKVDLGDELRDLVSGFSGICTAITCLLSGCVLVQVTGKYEPGQRDKNVHSMNVSHKRWALVKAAAVTLNAPTKAAHEEKAKELVPSHGTAVHKRLDISV